MGGLKKISAASSLSLFNFLSPLSGYFEHFESSTVTMLSLLAPTLLFLISSLVNQSLSQRFELQSYVTPL